MNEKLEKEVKSTMETFGMNRKEALELLISLHTKTIKTSTEDAFEMQIALDDENKCCICHTSLRGVPEGWREKNVCSGRCWGELYGEP
jgi:hypothetical protein